MDAVMVAGRLKRFRTPKGGGRVADPAMTERRLVGLGRTTLARLERLAKHFSTPRRRLSPMQVAAVLIELAAKEEAGRWSRRS